MFPVIKEIPHIDADVNRFLQKLRATSFTGKIDTDYATRLVNATDNSVYQVLPQAVLTPNNEQDVQAIFKLAAKASFHDIHFSARGGGTGTNGQSLNKCVVIDVAREQKQIVELNLAQSWVRVQPGVILDQLNDYLKPHGVFFAPNLSPSNRATIGGMANTDACGKGSRLYGRTSDHVLSMRVVLNDGSVLVTGRKDAHVFAQLKQLNNREGRLYNEVFNACNDAPLHEGAEKLGRFITAYNIWKPIQADGSFSLDPVICGSEGSLAIVTELCLKLTPIPQFKGLFAVRYRSFDLALEAAQTLLAQNPSAIETVDDKILTLAKDDVLFPKVKPYLGADENYHGNAVNLVEFIAQDAQSLDEKTAELKQRLGVSEGVVSFYYSTESQAQSALWELRKKGVGLLGNAKGKRRPIPFVEDTAVPPEHLADYIREFRALLDSHGLSYGMFGHVDVGCLHVRPALNLRTQEDEAIFQTISDGVYALLKKYGGVMWSEHGKGFRSWYGPAFHGDAIYQRMRQVKTAFDPRNQLNRGKICAPIESEHLLFSPFEHLKGSRDRLIHSEAESAVPGALYCNGNGQCFDYRMDSIMCPSYKATNNRLHSPKGRSGLMREWLTQVSELGVNLQKLSYTPADIVARELRRFGAKQSDFSHEVADAMNGCLGCKACASQCPIKVDVPTQKSLFLHHYHRRYPRKIRDYLMTSLEMWAPVAAHAPRIANVLLFNPAARFIAEKAFGLIHLPRFAKNNVYRLKRYICKVRDLHQLSDAERANTVIILQDPFTSFFDEHTLACSVNILEALGKQVRILPFIPLGKAQHVKGMLSSFNKTANNALTRLQALSSLSLPVICLESTQTLMFRQEYAEFSAQYELPKIVAMHEYLASQEILLPPQQTAAVYLFSHCSEKSQMGGSVEQWQLVFKKFGLDLTPVATGCCGMAGSYGHELEHKTSSETLWLQSWKDSVTAASSKGQVCASGFSCRQQSQVLNGEMMASPLQLLASRLVKK